MVAYVVKGVVATRYMLRERETREALALDRGAKFLPGEYSFYPPYKCQRLGATTISWRERMARKLGKRKIIRRTQPSSWRTSIAMKV